MIHHQSNSYNNVVVFRITKVLDNYIVLFKGENQLFKHLFTPYQMIDFKISLDKVYSYDEYCEIVKLLNVAKIYNKVLSFLKIKPRTKKEVIEYLKSNSISSNDINLIINKLECLNYLSDDSYVLHFIDDCLLKGYGFGYISYHLELKGISKDVIKKYLSDIDIEENIKLLITKYQDFQKTLINLPIKRQTFNIQRKMSQYGHSRDVIEKVIENIQFSEDLTISFNKDLNKIKKQTNDQNKIITKLIRLGYTYDYIKRHLDV